MAIAHKQVKTEKSPDALHDAMLVESRVQTTALVKWQNLLFGYSAAMRQIPAYLSFCRRHPKFGNLKLAEKIVAGLRRVVLTGKIPAGMTSWIDLLNQQYVPSTEDFGSESRAMEGALALIYLYKYVRTSRRKYVVEILRGICDCLLISFAENESKHLRALHKERSIRRRQFELIQTARRTTGQLLEKCLAIT